jgi:hypothetical protein
MWALTRPRDEPYVSRPDPAPPRRRPPDFPWRPAAAGSGQLASFASTMENVADEACSGKSAHRY